MVIMMMGAQYTSVHLQAGRCFLSFDLLPAIGAAAGDYLEWVDFSISDETIKLVFLASTILFSRWAISVTMHCLSSIPLSVTSLIRASIFAFFV